MNRNADPSDDVASEQKTPDQKKDTLSDGPTVMPGNRQTVGMTTEETMLSREKFVTAREEKANLRDRRIPEEKAVKDALVDLVSRLREANENLVIATVQAQSRSDELHQANEIISHLSQHDFLTGLPNRGLLSDRITQALELAKRRGTHLAVLFLDLDNFKHINDSIGHEIGDRLLQSVSNVLTACVRGSDTVSRLGGDEFVVLVTEDKYAENAALTADKILAALTAPHSIAEHELHVTTSIGISVFPADGADAETLIRNADTAMYQAKKVGRNNYQFFENDMNVRAVERQVVESHLRHALMRQEFVLHYQPKVNLASGKMTGAEALLRWTHPEWGVVLPERFISIAEESGLIVAIGRWVLREACAQTRRWEDAGLAPASIAVNISALEFRHKDFVEGVRAILNETGLAPACLQLEITESVLMRDVDSSTAILHQLKAMGVQLAVDDFGTGYSSLSYLNRFPIDVLKIDRSFVYDIGSANGDGIIVSAVIAMGASLRLQVIAEGVETPSQLAFLQAHDCEEGQGYIFSKPLATTQYAVLLAAGIPESLIDGVGTESEKLSRL